MPLSCISSPTFLLYGYDDDHVILKKEGLNFHSRVEQATDIIWLCNTESVHFIF